MLINYITDRLVSEQKGRVHCKKIANTIERIRKKWSHEPDAHVEGMCGNVGVIFSENKALITKDKYALVYEKKTHVSSWQQISSALALYRIISLLHCSIDYSSRNDFYKCNWSVTLVHKKSGQHLMLGEWKGGFQIFTEHRDSEDLTATFKKDIEELLTMLANPRMTIDYDGTIAGQVA